MNNHKPLEIAAKLLVQKSLWGYGHRAKLIRFSPIDIRVNERFAVKVLYAAITDEYVHIPEEISYCDAIALVVQTRVGTQTFWLRLGLKKPERLAGTDLKIDLETLIAAEFIASPKTLFTGYSKSKTIPEPAFTLLPDEWYSMREIARHRVIPGAGLKRVQRLVEEGKLRAVTWKNSSYNSTVVKGKWVQDYLAAMESEQQ